MLVREKNKAFNEKKSIKFYIMKGE